MKLE
jgi:hypothetical protein